MSLVAQFMMIKADWNAPDNIEALVTTRRGGVSSKPFDDFNLATHVGDEPQVVRQNRQLLAENIEPGLSLQWLQQQHGIRVVRAEDCDKLPEADAIVSRQSGIACCILTADCLPIFLTSKNGDEVAVIHAGWRGLAQGILKATIDQMNTPAIQIMIWFGPAIGPCHFEVGSEVRSAFKENTATEYNCFKPTHQEGKYMADLYGIAKAQATSAGVVDINGGDYCTYCTPELFYSYRREGVTGRMASLIYIK
jgi:hypothetical protein